MSALWPHILPRDAEIVRKAVRERRFTRALDGGLRSSMIIDYPHFADLDIAPDYLLIGASAMAHLRASGHVRPAVRAMPEAQRREYDRQQRRNWARKLGGRRIV